jgi:conjugative transfer signal peptidase TraF
MRDCFACLWLTGKSRPMPRFRRRRSRSRLIMLVGATGILPLGAAPVVVHPRPCFVHNSGASAPLGFYSVNRHHAIPRGDLVLATLPDAARRLAANRRYLPADVPIVKQVAAIVGDIVCAESGIVVINHRVAARTLLIDRKGRPLQAWHGCRPLTQGEIFLVNENVVASFNDRYFGPISSSAVIGRLRPLWTW